MMASNRPSAEGEQLGEQLARIAEKALEKLRERFPEHEEPCESCAFRRGTVPNQCLPTVMDALKCVVEQTHFYCHQGPKHEAKQLCTGYMIALAAVADRPPGQVPWQFSHVDELGDQGAAARSSAEHC